ncbi:LysR family transcriptional regulator [Pseudomonas carnis]|uniref:LysR substrate-binding domain-containing protein n=1 Tax=Pseudomonas carnis TaxID=2487355 RepID=A0ABT5RPR1_9PSED|nr:MULTISPECIES: LysR substrate-binding domain-containing protein [Pseudomonas]MBA1254393.1 LysR family transcriptional regulator [Pseudomonas carnis]MBA1269535.1 LysR family transcriptional regulator [Pseudomonas carnis]MBA1300523.1 LysR family transcriptional regulator [Pseudomonas carnis]MBJ2200109.1 LysR family transcriptional regulator [Pseudomonas carnis]MBJ2281001.1 LysR family transcriptional regulator [Pseudomonas sp. MF6767]
MAQRPPPTPMLQAFVSAAQTGSFARSASELNLTASAISHQIAGLEEWWGVSLFERHSRGVKLTAAGQALLPVTDEFFKALDGVLHSLNPGKSQPLYLSCTSSLCSTWLIPRMHGSHTQASFNLDLVLTSADMSSTSLEAHQYDVAVVMGYGDYPDHYVELLMRDAVFPVCSPDFLRLKGGIVLEDVARYPLIHRVDDQVCPGWESWFAFQGLAPPPYHHGPRFPDSSLAISLAVKGGGIALGRTALVYDQLEDGALVALNSPVMMSPAAYYIICRNGRQSEPEIARLIEWLKSSAGEFLREVRLRHPQIAAAGAV